jgi:multidrug efflux system outer membrane protein
MKRLLIIVSAAALVTGCNVGKKYVRPRVDVPAGYRSDIAPGALAPSDASTLADTRWFEVFKDQKLQDLVREALDNNYDLRVAVVRIDLARAQLGITRADQLPNVDANGDITTYKAARDGQQELPEPIEVKRTFGSLTLSLLNFELDLWSRLRNASEAQRQILLSERENRKAVLVALVAGVAAGYYQLREFDLELEIAQRTLTSRQESLRIIRLQEAAGIATMLDVRQAEELVQDAAARIPAIQRSIGLQENFLSTLVGSNPREIARGDALADQPMPPDVPTGLASDLIERRPDILAAERLLESSNAQVGAAKAAFFPRISLTGLFGFQSDQLSNLFSGPARIWTFTPAFNQPIFQGGRLKSNYRLAKAQRDIALIEYERAIQNGFREVSDALISHKYSRLQRVE